MLSYFNLKFFFKLSNFYSLSYKFYINLRLKNYINTRNLKLISFLIISIILNSKYQ